MTVTNVDNLEFPVGPVVRTSPDFHSEPPVERRWINYNNGGHEYNMLWMGQCRCGYCGYQLFDAPSFLPQEGAYANDPIANIWGSSYKVADRDRMVEYNIITEDWAEDWLPSISWDCVTRASRRNEAINNGRNNPEMRRVVWPDEVFTEQKRIAAEKAEAERKVHAVFLVPHPVVPVHGAHVWVHNEKWERFDEWTEAGRIKVIGSTESLAVEDVLVATSVMYGAPHENAIIVPGHGHTSDFLCTVKKYSGYNVSIKTTAKDTVKTVPLNALAALVPPLNPETEEPEARAERLERELDRLKELMHRRMVAEGEARQWCGEFDPILDSSGLKPRKAKRIIKGIIVFEYEADAEVPKQTVTKMLKGSLEPTNAIPSQHLRLLEFSQSEPVYTAHLS